MQKSVAAITIFLLLCGVGCQRKTVKTSQKSQEQGSQQDESHGEHPSKRDWHLETVQIQPILDGAVTIEIVGRTKHWWGLAPKNGSEWIIYHIAQPGTYTVTHELPGSDCPQDFEIIADTPQSIAKEYGHSFGMPGKWNDNLTITISKVGKIPYKPQKETINPTLCL